MRRLTPYSEVYGLDGSGGAKPDSIFDKADGQDEIAQMKKLLSLMAFAVFAPATAHSQAYEDMLRQHQGTQLQATMKAGGVGQTNSEIGSEADQAMRDRLQNLVSDGKCDDALRIARRYKNETLIANVQQACGS